MKKLFLGLLVLAAMLVAAYRISCKAPSESLSPQEQVLAIFEDGGCISCHSAEPKLPFYASFPVMGDVVVADSQAGYQMFDIEPLLSALKSGEKLSEVDVAKVECVALNGTMPLAKYYLVHWGSQVTEAKGAIVAAWAEHWRAEYYNDGLGGEPIRPIAESVEYDAAKAELGRKLYHDTRLSVDNTVSCASCHSLSTAGVDNKQYSEGVGGQFGGVNAPTVYNAVYNFVQFWDGRAATLALQAAGPPLNPDRKSVV